MILKDTLEKIVESQREELLLKRKEVVREKLKQVKLTPGFAVIISGIRRSGKSTLLKQLMSGISDYHYLNFEDPRLVSFELEDFQKLDSIFRQKYGNNKTYFFDEIQNIEKWELHVRSLLDKRCKVMITGSNASLLSRELGTRLTGRHMNISLFPFSYNEFLLFTNRKPALKSFQDYMSKGGFPEYLRLMSDEVLHQLLNDILVRDIAVRYGVRNIKELKEIALYLISNSGKKFSFNSLKNMFNLGSVNSVSSYLSYFEDSYLMFTVPRFSYSLKKQRVNPKKIYCIDNGLICANTTSFSEDKGRVLENLVYISLKRKNNEIFYFQDKNECDFLIKQAANITDAIQVCYKLDEDNKTREINGLIQAMETFSLEQGMILTLKQEDQFNIDGRIIKVVPVWKWLKNR